MWTLSPLMLVAAYLLGQHTAHSKTIHCLEAVKILQLEQQEMNFDDMDFPSCDKFGNFEQKQCSDLGTGFGWCRCVERESGRTYPNMYYVNESSVDAKKMTCQCVTDQKTAAERKKECDLNTGDYKPVTCTAKECVCTHRAGGKMQGYLPFQRGESNCLCARAAYPSMPGKTISCDEIGRYKQKQCHGSKCFCVDENGKKTTRPVRIGSNAHRNLECPKK